MFSDPLPPSSDHITSNPLSSEVTNAPIRPSLCYRVQHAVSPLLTWLSWADEKKRILHGCISVFLGTKGIQRLFLGWYSRLGRWVYRKRLALPPTHGLIKLTGSLS
jgi:hypothetical protein